MQQIQRMTFVAFALFAFNGLFNLLPGVLLIDIAKSFQVDTHIIGYIYSLFVVGNVLAVQMNGKLLEKLNIQKELLSAIGLVLLGILGVTSVSQLPVFAFFIFLCGIGGGIFNSTGNYLIVNLFDAKTRSAKLNLLHFTFSVGAILSPLLSGIFLDAGIPWQHIYRYALLLLAILAVLVAATPIVVRKQQFSYSDQGKETWGFGIYAIAIGLFCYMISEQSFVFWGNTYFIEQLSFDMAESSKLVSLFWVCMAFGRGTSGLVLNYIKVEKYILVCSCLGFAAFLALLHSTSLFAIAVFVACMGLSFSGLYASILSYGTLQLKAPTPRLVSFYITFGCLGGVLATPSSSFLKAYLGLNSALMISAGFMALIFLLITLTRYKYAFRNAKYGVGS